MCKVPDIVYAISVRMVLCLHSLFTIWRAADVKDNDTYWLLILTNILLLIEGAYTVKRRNGQETKWFCFCLLIYLICTIPAIWILELDKLADYENIVEKTNISAIQKEALSSVSGVTIPIQLEADTWVAILEQLLLFLLIIGRWMLPRGKLTRDQLSQLLFVYIGIASDCMELFVLFEEEQVRKDRQITYATLTVWSLSLLQFTIALTATKMSRKRVATVGFEDNQNGAKLSVCERLFMTEIWSLIISIVLMDGPYLSLRLYCLIVFNILSYGIIFFAFKNALMIGLLIYRIVIVCNKKSSKKEDNEDYSVEMKSKVESDNP